MEKRYMKNRETVYDRSLPYAMSGDFLHGV